MLIYHFASLCGSNGASDSFYKLWRYIIFFVFVFVFCNNCSKIFILTVAGESISRVSWFTGTREVALSVSADGISATTCVVWLITLVDICVISCPQLTHLLSVQCKAWHCTDIKSFKCTCVGLSVCSCPCSHLRSSSIATSLYPVFLTFGK